MLTLDFPTYFTLVLGIMYSGYTPFPISVRNSALAVADLLKKTTTSVLLVSRDAGMQRLASEVKATLTTEGLESHNVHDILAPTYNELFDNHDPRMSAAIYRAQSNDCTTAVILHSSGKHHSTIVLFLNQANARNRHYGLP